MRYIARMSLATGIVKDLLAERSLAAEQKRKRLRNAEFLAVLSKNLFAGFLVLGPHNLHIEPGIVSLYSSHFVSFFWFTGGFFSSMTNPLDFLSSYPVL
jgi:hypothetical protein